MWPWNHFNTINTKLDNITALLNQLIKQESVMAIDLTSITAEVTNNANVTASVIALLNNLTSIIKNIPPSTDQTTQAALDQLTATLSQNDTAVANAVVANTIAGPPSAPPSTPPST